MKHIFMGKINYIDYEFVCYYKYNGYWGSVDKLVIESLEKFNSYITYFSKGGVDPKISNIEYETIKETTDIQERVLENSNVKINDEELYIEKVVQCDNGDVICYTNKVLKEIKNEKSKRIAEELKDECYRAYREYMLNKKITITTPSITENNKKWWQFWR